MCENIEILNLQQKKGEEIISYQNQIKKKKKTRILTNKTVYFGLSILDLSKTVIYEFWYDYVKTKYGKKT